MAQHGKRYRQARGTIDREQAYSPVEAIKMLKSFDGPKFDETVEVHFRLGLNVRHADEQLRVTLMLPHVTGKDATVAVFAEGEKAKEAQDAGADIVGSADLAKQIEEGFTDSPSVNCTCVRGRSPSAVPVCRIRSTSLCASGTGFAPAPTKPVTPGVFFTTDHASSFRSMFTST